MLPDGADKLITDITEKLKTITEIEKPQESMTSSSYFSKKKERKIYALKSWMKTNTLISSDSTSDTISVTDPREKRASILSSLNKIPTVSEFGTIRPITPPLPTQDIDTLRSNLAINSGEPFELRALEAIFMVVCDTIGPECIKLELNIKKVLQKLLKKSSGILLETLRQRKNEVSKVLSKINALRGSFSDILNDDNHLTLMQLTKVCRDPERYAPSRIDDVVVENEGVELLMESYLEIFDEMATKIELLELELQTTENIITLRLDLARNALMKLDLMVSCVTSMAGICAVVAGM